MGAPRKLPPEEEAALIAWYSQYRAAMEAVRKVGTIKQMASLHGISVRSLYVICDREREKTRRILRELASGVKKRTLKTPEPVE